MKWPITIDRPAIAAIALSAFVAMGHPVLGGSTDPESYAPYPEPGPGYVTDLASVVMRLDEQRLESLLHDVEKDTGVELVVVTIGSIGDYPETGAETIEEFATGLFDAYRIGNMPRNDGVLLVVARDDRRARIELGAHYGRDRDADAQRIMNQVIIPAFKSNDYSRGIREGVEALMLEFAGVRVGYDWPLILTLVVFPVAALLSFSLYKSGKKGWGWVCVGLLVVLVLAVVRLARSLSTVVHDLDSDSSGDFGGGGSGGGSSGGFGGGFGGGSSGGGGATGSW